MQRTSVFKFLMISLYFVTFYACEKDFLPEADLKKQETTASVPIVFNGADTEKTLDFSKTELGVMRQNPYTVENLATAMNEVYGTNIDKVATSDLYVKFELQSNEDFIVLEALGLMLFDFPLEYEVLEMGDYYFEQETKDDYPVLWTVVKPDFAFPNIQYEIIAELNLNMEADPFLMRKAFEQTGNLTEAEERYPISNEILEKLGGDDDCYPGCDAWPCCLVGDIACDEEFTPEWCKGWDIDCYPGSPDYPNCLNAPGGNVEYNDCGCLISSNKRYPGGCVQVQDTELGMEGVRNVKVIGWNGWFRLDKTSTNDSGCWSISRDYRGKAWFWVKFKNGGTKVCSAPTGARFWQHIWAVTDPVGRVDGPNFNNITINYNAAAAGSQAHKYWGVASVNNAFYEFQDFAANSGINAVPPVTLYAAPGRRDGFALMTSYIGPSAVRNIIATELFETDGLTIFLSSLGLFADFGVEATQEAEAMYAAAGGAIAGRIAPLIPDVMIGTNWNNSDELRELAFHELGHASLFPSMGTSYWQDLAIAELVADILDGHPWGVPTSQGAGRIAIVESWAEHVGHLFADEKYGSNVSATSTFLSRLERIRNFRTNHIPIGIYLDLFDTGTEPVSSDDFSGGSGIVNDAVSGFTTGQVFGLFDPSVTSPTILQSRINTTLVPGSGNTVSAVNALFVSY